MGQDIDRLLVGFFDYLNWSFRFAPPGDLRQETVRDYSKEHFAPEVDEKAEECKI